MSSASKMENGTETSDIVAHASYISPPLLPIAAHRHNILYLVETCAVTVIVAATGSGKTTQIPQFLDHAGWCEDGMKVAVTQPRRVAATAVAARVAAEMSCPLGEDVGYSIRFEDFTSAATRIKYMTDGMLLREALADPLLSRYSVIMVDEAHERSVGTDILLGLLKKILRRRTDLRLVVSSATLQAQDFKHFFERNYDSSTQNDPAKDSKSAALVCGILSIEGRMFPVDVLHLEEPTENYIERAVETVITVHQEEQDGDILVFLSGREEIELMTDRINHEIAKSTSNPDSILVLPMFAGLSRDQQLAVFESCSTAIRKIILSTNVAEASVTIEGIAFVVDCGYVKLRSYDPRTGIDSLVSTPISKASAAQRAGRAGRTKSGKCFRLYTEAAFLNMTDITSPEIQRTNLAPMILQLKALGIDNIAKFDLLTTPPSELVKTGLELLYALEALDEYARLSKPNGIRMAELAIHPMMAKSLLLSTQFGCLSEMLSITAMTSLPSGPWLQDTTSKGLPDTTRRKFATEEGDHLTLLNVYESFMRKGKRDAKWCKENNLDFKAMNKASSIRGQLERTLKRHGIYSDASAAAVNSMNDHEFTLSERLCRCLTAGFFAHAARMQPDGTFRIPGGQDVLRAHPSSLLFNRKADWVVFHEVNETAGKIFIRDITKVQKGWLIELGSTYYQPH